MKNSAQLGRAVLVALTLAIAAVASVRVASADDALPVQFDYEARPGCPDADSFVRDVLARAPRARVAATQDRARFLVVRIHPSGRGLEGVLFVRDVDGTTRERSVHSESCAELVTALAVIAAVVIDPVTARVSGLDGGVESRVDAAPALPAPPAPEPMDASAPPGAPPVAPPKIAAGVSSDPPGWTWSAGGGAGVVGGASPSVLVSFAVFVEAGRVATGIFKPSARLRFQRTSAGGPDRLGAGARFVLTSGGVDLCPIALLARPIRLQPCARAELGGLSAEGRDVEPVRTTVRPWAGVGPLVRGRLGLTGPLFAELEMAVLALIVRDRFLVEPNTLVYVPPVVAGSAAVAFGLAF